MPVEDIDKNWHSLLLKKMTACRCNRSEIFGAYGFGSMATDPSQRSKGIATNLVNVFECPQERIDNFVPAYSNRGKVF
jgi:hypothetical protein